jgi:predicted permease
MRKKTIRNGMRLILAALMIIIIVSFYLGGLGDFVFLSYESEARLYQLGIFVAAAMGGYGVVQSVFGFILPARQGDNGIRILPLIFLIVGLISLFFYLLAVSLTTPNVPDRERVRPGETITI